MDIHDIRQQLQTKSIYDIPLRVTYYARVSSESDEQLNSLGNQIQYYEDLIRRNTAWTFVPGYIDEGLSGISTKHRENFNRMVEDAAEDKFDLIITKEISRFARNTLDSIQFTRQLLSYGVGVFFQNDNINTFDEDSELRLSIMSSIAQDELRKLSSRVNSAINRPSRITWCWETAAFSAIARKTAGWSLTRNRHLWYGSCSSCTPQISTA